ncbi:MAG: carbohydrate kinase family protein [Christensenellales bacterium]
MAPIAVFGTVFVDLKGFPFGKYLPTGRNVGSVLTMHGGVSRNIAENFANIGADVLFVTMLEDSALGQSVRVRLMERGVGLKYSVNAENGMGLYMAIFDETGALAASISKQPDFRALENLIDREGDAIMEACGNVVLEIDLIESIAEKVFRLAKSHKKEVYAVVGNMNVILRRPDFLRDTSLFILNEIEAGSLLFRTLDPQKPEEVLAILKQETAKRGIRRMIITLGEYGSVCYDSVSGESGIIRAVPTKAVDTTGAGDAFFTAAVAAWEKGATLCRAAELGSILASRTIQTKENVCPADREFLIL